MIRISRRYLSLMLTTLALGLPAAGSAMAQTKTEATLAGILPREHLLTKSFQVFADKLAEKTGGALTVKVVHSSQLGGLKETTEATISGNLEFTQINNALLGSFYSRTMLFDLPFIFRDNDHMKKVVRGTMGTEIYKEFEARAGLKILMAGLPDGPRSVWNSKRQIVQPADMKGMRLRVMESPIMIATFEQLGAIPVPMAFPEVYMAARQGVIDGAETPAGALTPMRVPEIAKYYSLTRHFALPAAIAVNSAWFAKRPKAQQDAILQAAEEARAWYDSEYDADEKASLAAAVKDGLVVNEVGNVEDFRKAVAKVYDTYRERVGGDAQIQAVMAVK